MCGAAPCPAARELTALSGCCPSPPLAWELLAAVLSHGSSCSVTGQDTAQAWEGLVGSLQAVCCPRSAHSPAGSPAEGRVT